MAGLQLEKQNRRKFKETLIKHLNQKIQNLLVLFEVEDWDDLFSSEHTSQVASKRGSLLSDIVDLCLEKTAAELNWSWWKFEAGPGYDSTVRGTKIEHKFSASTSNHWSGHPYSNKVDDHLLIKLKIKINRVSHLFVAHTKTPHYSNKENQSNNSYCSIYISNDATYNVLIGNLIPTVKWCKVEYECVL